MEDMRSSRRPARSFYGEVFSGPLKFSSAPFGAKSDVYAEIFGGTATSCSIPFLDLPPSPDDLNGEVLIDYSEIFGRSSGGGDFAVDYEDLFGDKKKTTRASSKERFVAWFFFLFPPLICVLALPLLFKYCDLRVFRLFCLLYELFIVESATK